jgi:hypothetical protein
VASTEGEVAVLRLTPLVALAALVLALPVTALAKEVSKVEICGPNDCASITDRALLGQWMESSDGSTTGPAAIAPFLRLEFTVTAAPGETFEDGKNTVTWSDYYVPGAHVERGTGESGEAAWTRLGPRATEILRTAAAGIEPFPAPVVDSAMVGGRRAAGAATYARLFDRTWKPTYQWPASTKRIRLHSNPASPWTDGKNELRFSAKQRLLVRDGETVKVPSSVARQLGRARSLTGRADSGSALALGFAGVAAAGLAGAAWWGHKRRRS